MRHTSLFILITILLLAIWKPVNAQDTIRFETLTSIKDIPHEGFKQKWMWIHRSIVFSFLKSRVPFYDTSYYESYKSKLVFTIPISTRYIGFDLKDASSSNSLNFMPNSQYDVGISVNSKFASFLINTGVVLFNKDERTKGKTDYKDYQFNLYGKRSTIDVNLQTYKGFYINNSRAFEDYTTLTTNPYEIRNDISALSLGLNYYYIFNYKKFSYRNSFAFTEHQKRSAGSLLAGGYYSILSVNGDSAFVSTPFKNYFDTLSIIKNANIINYGVNIGYIYTLVIKKFYATLSLVQGIGIDKTNTITQKDVHYSGKQTLSSKQNLRMGIGYNSGTLFFGSMAMFDFYYFDNSKRTAIDYSYGKIRVFAGYRFNIERQQRKFFTKLNLMDYRL